MSAISILSKKAHGRSTIIPVSFYRRATKTVARKLLGKELRHSTPAGVLSGIIIETEAYLPAHDPACHAARGKTTRNAPMFGAPGYAYIYFCYGNHWLFNIVTEAEGTPAAVLIRALEPFRGIPLMQQHRAVDVHKNLTNGPGKLTQALGITPHYNTVSLLKGTLTIRDRNIAVPNTMINVTGRIGIQAGKELPLRFLIRNHPCRSK